MNCPHVEECQVCSGASGDRRVMFEKWVNDLGDVRDALTEAALSVADIRDFLADMIKLEVLR